MHSADHSDALSDGTPLDWTAEFPALVAPRNMSDGERIFLNHAGVAPIPARAAAALQRYAGEAAHLGSAAWPDWAARLKAVRQSAAELLGAGINDIAFVHNTTHGLLCVANSLPWRPGENIVTAEHEFPANVHPWRNLAERGVAVRVVPERADHRFRIEDFRARLDSRTRLVAVSLVQYSTGLRMPVEALAELCHERGSLLCLDGIQGLGALPQQVGDLGCDMLAADGHKWLLGPEGAGLLYVRPGCAAAFNDSMVGWIGRPNFQNYDDLDQPPLAGARRFEDGSHNLGGNFALGASLDLLNRYGRRRVWARIERLTDQLTEGLRRAGWTIHSPRGEGERSGIVACSRAGLDAAAAVARLAQAGIVIAARRGWLRISPHFYNQPGQIDILLAALKELA